MNHGLYSTLLLLNNAFKDRIEIEEHWNENLQPIEWDPGQLNQVFANIINNAIQAIDGTGKITIKPRKIKSQAVIWITYTGKGIPEDPLKQIFDPFFTGKEVGEVKGPGLPTTYGMIQ